jgi:hypothetical protein
MEIANLFMSRFTENLHPDFLRRPGGDADGGAGTWNWNGDI